MSNDLRFYKPLDTSQPVSLRFGTAPPVIPTYTIVLNAAIPAPKLAAYVVPPDVARLTATIPAPKLNAAVTYDNAVFRGVAARSKVRWQVADNLEVKRQDFTHPTIKLPTQVKQFWTRAQTADRDAHLSFYEGIKLRNKGKAAWGAAVGVKTVAADNFKQLVKRSEKLKENWQSGAPITAKASSTWIQLVPLSGARFDDWSEARHIESQQESRVGGAVYLSLQEGSRWQEAVKPKVGRYGVVVLPPIVPPCYLPPAGSAANLVFQAELNGATSFRFACNHGVQPPTATIVIPIKRAYIVINDVHLTRLEDGLELPAYSMSLSIDMDSWTWGFTASLPADQLTHLEPTLGGEPVALSASINGQDYTILAENISRDRVFANSRITVSGRGHSAVLADPYSPILTFNNVTQDRTAQQLMNDALTVNGVSLGWDIDWRIDDWLVPQGAWGLQGSYMQAVTAIAQSVGAFVQPDEIAKTLRILKRYPAAPWDWATTTPDYEIPASVITRESVTRSRKPDYNAVYVSGTTAGGVLGRAVRSGTAGDSVAPLITDALITNEIAVRQRALPTLADVGDRADYSLSLPILVGVGAISPGKLIRYIDNGKTTTGISKSLSITVNKSNVVQLIGVETRG